MAAFKRRSSRSSNAARAPPHNPAQMPKGEPLGSYETWCDWCRTPLLALGCQDPVERIDAAKAKDPRRSHITDVFTTWWEHHRDELVAVAGLHEAVQTTADPQRRGRQYLQRYLPKLVNTRMAGYVLTSQGPAGKWSATTYQLKRVDGDSQ
jgi:hypothetical protein